MAKNLVISILATFFVCIMSPSVLAGGSKKAKALADGFVLAGVDGKLTRRGSDGDSQSLYTGFGVPDRWFFEFDSDVGDGRGLIKAGAVSEMLPSAALEKMVADMEERSDASPVRSKSPGASYRLWGRVTKYKGRNFIFGIYFLPISETDEPEPSQQSRKSQQRESKLTESTSARKGVWEPTINEPNDVLTIPEEIIAKLASRRTVRTERLLKKGLELKQDCVLADRTGFIRDSGQEVSFVLDALGRGVQQISLRLLPCHALERAQLKQSAELEPLRFRMSGIVTKYKGEHYLLLQRAIRVYSHENFDR